MSRHIIYPKLLLTFLFQTNQLLMQDIKTIERTPLALKSNILQGALDGIRNDG